MAKAKSNILTLILLTIIVILVSILLYQKGFFNSEKQNLGKTNFNSDPEFTESTKYYWKFWRNIVADFNEGVLFIDKFTDDGHIFGYRVDVIELHNRIAIFNLSSDNCHGVCSQNINNRPRRIFSFCNKKLFWLLKQQFYHDFAARLNESELFANYIVYGDNCGIAPIDPPERIIIDNFVKTAAKDSLLKWLQSTNTEKQMYAVDGLLQLKNKGISLSEFELTLIHKVLSKKGTIYTCSGCDFNPDKIERIRSHFE